MPTLVYCSPQMLLLLSLVTRNNQIYWFVADIEYFHCLQIIEILKETEADSWQSLLRRYGSQRMKDWQEIVQLYENDNVYLAEAAQILMRNVAYEVPGLKKGLARCEQIQNVSNPEHGALFCDILQLSKSPLY